MKTRTVERAISRFVSLLFFIAGTAVAQRGPQDNWVVEVSRGWTLGNCSPAGICVGGENLFVADCSSSCVRSFSQNGNLLWTWGSYGTGISNCNAPRAIAADGGELFLTDTGNGRIMVLSTNGTLVRAWGTAGTGDGQFNGPWGIAVDTQLVFVADTSNHRVQVLTKAGTFVRQWGRLGSVLGAFNLPSGIAVDRTSVYVADRNNHRVQVFTKEGKFLRSWSKLDENNDPSNQPLGIAVDDDSVYVCFGYPSYMSGWTARLVAYDKYGVQRWTSAYPWNYDGQPLLSGPMKMQNPRGIAVQNPFVYVADETCGVVVFRRIYRTLGTLAPNAIPLADVLACRQREGTSILDVDYAVDDNDDATVTTYGGVFAGAGVSSVPSLNDFLPMRTFVEGTGNGVGTGIAVRTTHRLSWDMAADGMSGKIAEYGNVKVALMAKDKRGLVDFHFLNIPPIGTNAAFKIDRAPLQQSDLLPLWFWLLAAGDTNIALAAGTVTGVSGGYAGQTLAQGTNTTDLGRAFLFGKMNVREATGWELKLAREASSPGKVMEWTPRQEPPAPGSKVNAFNFVTNPTNGWWVVPLNP